MKSESGGDDIHNRRNALQFDAGEIAVASEVAVRLMTANAGPVVGGLEGQVDVLSGLQFQDGQAVRPRDAQQVKNAVTPGSLREYLFVDVIGIKHRIDATDILKNIDLHPALGLRAVEWMASVRGQ